MSPRHPFPEDAIETVRRFCEKHSPAEHQDKIRVSYERRGSNITIFELNAPWDRRLGTEWIKVRVAQLRFEPVFATWSLHFSDRNGRWHVYPPAKPNPNLNKLLAEIERDQTGIFWG